MIQTDLYFAQSRPDGSLIDKADWDHFNETQIKRVFINGSTTVNATGTWHDPVSHKLISEPTHVVTYYYKKSAVVSKQIDSLITTYKTKFKQQSVLRVDKKVKVSL